MNAPSTLCQFGVDTPQRCERPAYCKGFCASHYKQHQRRKGLKPIRAGKGVRLPGITVTQECATRLRQRNDNLYLAAQETLETWA